MLLAAALLSFTSQVISSVGIGLARTVTAVNVRPTVAASSSIDFAIFTGRLGFVAISGIEYANLLFRWSSTSLLQPTS